jgi:hypothetical protein
MKNTEVAYRVTVLEVHRAVYTVVSSDGDDAIEQVYCGDREITLVGRDFDYFLKDSTEVELLE